MQEQEIYMPKEDSYLLAQEIIKFLKKTKQDSKQKLKTIQILDMGSGSGIQAQTCLEMQVPRQNILCLDINPIAIKHLKNHSLNAKQSDLFNHLQKQNLFDLILFNPPYLPASKYDDNYDTTAGKQGHELITRFLHEAKPHLTNKGTILLLFSNLSKPKIILQNAKQLGYKSKKLIEKPVGFFEQLFVYELSLLK